MGAYVYIYVKDKCVHEEHNALKNACSEDIVVYVISIIAALRNDVVNEIKEIEDEMESNDYNNKFIESEGYHMKECEKLIKKNKKKNTKLEIILKEKLIELGTLVIENIKIDVGYDVIYTLKECIEKVNLSEINWHRMGDKFLIIPTDKQCYQDVYEEVIDDEPNLNDLDKMDEIALNNIKNNQMLFVSTFNKMIWDCSDDEILLDFNHHLPEPERIKYLK